MAHSRLEKVGTIYSRITGLINCGAMKIEDRPIWYEVYEAFPPENEPSYSQIIPKTPIKNIFYPEDEIRSLFYKRMGRSPLGRLDDSRQESLSQKCIALSMEMAKEKKLSLLEAFEIASVQIMNEVSEMKQNSIVPKHNLNDLFKDD